MVSSSLRQPPDLAVHVIERDPLSFVRQLKERPGRALWLCGGGKLAASLFDAIDEVIVKINPLLLGAGVPMFAGEVRPTALRLIERKVYANGFVRMHHVLSASGS